MELTENEAITATKIMWKKMMEEGWTKDEYARIYPEVQSVSFQCYLCEFSHNTIKRIGCAICPYYKHHGETCHTSGSPLREFEIADDSIDRSYWAKKVLAEVEAIPYTKEPVWKDVTDECELLLLGRDGVHYVTLQHDEKALLQWGGTDQMNNLIEGSHEYKLELSGIGYNLNMFKILKKEE